MKRAVVLGGGVAGIAAAFAARDRGLEVELLESRRWLGGRAFTLPRNHGFTTPPDNGPHVMLGCYEHMRGLLRRLGTEDAFDQAPSLRLAFADRGGEQSELRLSRWPAPVALMSALMRFRGMSFGARLRAFRAMATIPFGIGRARTLADWIERRGQSGAPRSYLWDPLCRSIMNAEAEDVSAALFVATLKRAFLGNAAHAAIWVPLRPWGEIIGRPAAAALEAVGASVRTGLRVTGLSVEKGSIRALEFHGGESLPVDRDTVVVSALPWYALGGLGGGVGLAPLAGAPIVSVYFESPASTGLPENPVVSLVDGHPFHFYCRTPGAPAGCFALLSGGCRDLDGVKTAEIEARARAQLAQHFPHAVVPPGTARVVREDRATFVGSPDIERPQPGQHPSIENLWICGDWTETGLPSTLEGAVESANRVVAKLPG